MKRILFTMLTLMVISSGIFAQGIDVALQGNTSVKHKVNMYQNQGYELVMDQCYYNQHRYVMQPSFPFMDGFGVIKLRKSSSNMSLTTYYVTISFDLTYRKKNQVRTNITDITVNTVY